MTTTFEPIIGPAPKTEDWLAYRQYNPERKIPVVIGASNSYAAVTNPFEVYMEQRESWQREATDAMDMGNRLEPVILDVYEEKEATELERNLPMMMHPMHRFIGASLDARRTDCNQIPVDAKATSYRMLDENGIDPMRFGQEGTDQVPAYILFQMQQQMYVTGTQQADVAVLIDGRNLRIFPVDRNDDLIAHIVECETELAQRIVDGNPPEPNWEHSNTRPLLRELYGFSADKIVELDDSYRDLWMEIQRLGDIEKKAKADREALKNKILAAMQDAQVARFGEAGFELNRVQVKASTYTVNRKASEQLRQRKVK